MRINELIQVGTETVIGQMPILDEEGNPTGEFETVTREKPIMQSVTRDMTPEEVAQAEAEAAAMPEPEPTAEELIGELTEAVADLSMVVSDNSMDNESTMDAIADLSMVVSDMAARIEALEA